MLTGPSRAAGKLKTSKACTNSSFHADPPRQPIAATAGASTTTMSFFKIRQCKAGCQCSSVDTRVASEEILASPRGESAQSNSTG